MTAPAQHASDTPRTDVAAFWLLFKDKHSCEWVKRISQIGFFCESQHARQLERELAVAEGALKNIQDETNGGPVKKPVDAIKAHLNPYLLDQDYMRRMTTLERNRYLTELFGVDTAEEDGAILEAERQASQLRIKVKLYGALDLTPVERVDVEKIKAARAGIIEQHAAKVRDAQARQATVMVTVVGDKPAVIPENVGAYVVEGGKVTP